MQIRNVEELVDTLDTELHRRRHEISNLHLLIVDTRRTHYVKALRRMAVPLLYSHWEGFVKQASRAYLSLVVQQKATGRELTGNFLALACGKQFREAIESNSSAVHVRFVERVLSLLDETIRFNVDAPLKFEGNLSPKVLKRIFESLGIEYSTYWRKKEKFIQDVLLRLRNQIAHGTLVPVEAETYEEVKDFVTEALTAFKADVENAAALKDYAV